MSGHMNKCPSRREAVKAADNESRQSCTEIKDKLAIGAKLLAIRKEPTERQTYRKKTRMEVCNTKKNRFNTGRDIQSKR